MKTFVLILTLAGSMAAETVYFGKTSKVFHKQEACGFMKAATHQAERAEAVKRGLRECGRCYRAHTAKKTGNEAWAAPVKGGK